MSRIARFEQCGRDDGGEPMEARTAARALNWMVEEGTMTELRDELLARIRLAMVGELGLREIRIPEGWNYKEREKVVAFVGKKRALVQVSLKLPAEEAAEALRRVDVEPHPMARLANAGWVTMNVYEEAQLATVLEWTRKSIGLLGKQRARGEGAQEG